MSDSCDRSRCKKSVHSIDEERRKEINNNYWNLSWIEKKNIHLGFKRSKDWAIQSFLIRKKPSTINK